MSNLQKLIENGGKVAIAYSSLTGNVYKTDVEKEKLAKIAGVLVGALEKYQHFDDESVKFLKGFSAQKSDVDVSSLARTALQQAEKIAGE